MFSFEKTALIRQNAGELLRIESCGPNALRVRATRAGAFSDKPSAVACASTPALLVEADEKNATVTNGKLRAVMEGDHGKLSFYCGDRLLLSEKLQAHPLKIFAREFKDRPEPGKYKITARFDAQPGEKIFGMGQYQQPQLNLKGSTLELAHRNSQASVPFLISDRGYGFLWNLPAIGEVSFAENVTKWTAEMADSIDYVVIAGDTPAEILEAYMDLTGKPPMMPEYAMGFWQSKLRYRTREELMGVAREYKRRGIPLSVIVCDFFHWPHQGDFRFDEDYFPDPDGMIRELKEMGVELMVSIWPTVQNDSENYAEMKERGYLISDHRDNGPHASCYFDATFYDTTNPGAREFVWNTCKANYYDKGIRVFWLDEAEPEYKQYDFDNHQYYLGDCLEVGNYYPVTYAQNFYEGMQGEGQENILNLIRCAWAGSQKYGTLVWSGDIMPTFESLRCQVSAGLNMAMAGIPWWTTDIGGFDGGKPESEEYRELMVRWFEYATFCPVLRMHGWREPALDPLSPTGGGACFSGSDNELWSYGETAYEIMKDHIFLRERMRPYIRTVMEAAHQKGTPPMRPLFYAYPEDARAWEIDDEYLFGDDLLIAPVLTLGARSRRVYLPAGTWTDAYTGRRYEGNTTLEADAPLDRIPVFIREGATIPQELFKI
ncbi:MAG: glycoside hydrolase family 31 protein [Clostridia bacterium]|nr:glycoside hydrolase family 31 protein [Clostridia bacterium]